MFICILFLYLVAKWLYFKTSGPLGAFLMNFESLHNIGAAMRYGSEWAEYGFCIFFVISILFLSTIKNPQD